MSNYPLKIWIPGKPAKQGSKRIVPHTRKLVTDNRLMKVGAEQWLRLKDVNNPKYVLILDADTENKKWRQKVATIVANEFGKPLFDEGVMVVATFLRVRGETHYTATGKLSAHGKRHPLPDTRPDTIKMMRSVEDALQGVLWTEDSRITTTVMRKRWHDEEGMFLLVWPESEAPEIKFIPRDQDDS